MGLLKKIFGDYSSREIKRITPIKDKVLALDEEYSKLTDEELKAKTPYFKERLANGETLDDILPEAFAACREASWRVLGMKHFPVQILGGIVLHQGRIAEMKTGEGKTLVATLPAYLNALSGNGVHIVTVNDYLARRDSEWMGKVYRFLGLKVGLIIHEKSNDERREAYAADITYGTNNEMGFDYLRDNMVPYKELKVQRGHSFAIVDEVDSILIDEARTPLIISGRGDRSTDLYKQANAFARTLNFERIKELRSSSRLEDTADQVSENCDVIVDEKARTAVLTQKGIAKAEKYFNLDNLMDPANMTIQHHINQAIKAIGVMRRDVDYVVKDGQVLIVDEFTGRIMLGRRYNEGLHQAIEAKEGVNVEHESKTLATITFQNYFRLYDKLSGMTGTAMTESEEFQEIYSLDVVEIPTNKPMIRKDMDDLVYKTEPAKFNAVIDDIVERHEKGQPVLVGTISIEKSETLSKLLKKRGIKHEVLNAKYHEKEAEIVAQAGKLGAVTIATNMAGRGTDIMLGGNAEFLAKSEMRRKGYSEELIAESTGFGDTDNEDIISAREEFQALEKKYKNEISGEAEQVRQAGGLCIIGTERHESRRIDNQLRGRSGRQGDPGASRFYLSLEDDLMRLFGGDRVSSLMDTLKIDEDTPIENRMITNTLESAQKKLEGRNFEIRKNVLKYDDVMNQQREIIYGQRRKVLDGEDISTEMHKMLRENIDSSCDQFLAGDVKDDWDFGALRRHYLGWLTTEEDLHYTVADFDDISRKGIADQLYDRGMKILADKEQRYGAPIMRELERICLLKCVDRMWMDHIDNMDQLRQGIALRGYGQKDPVVEYRIEGFDMFDQMVDSIRESSVKMLLTIEIRQAGAAPKREQVAKPTGEGFVPGNGAPGAKGAPHGQPVRVIKIGRNDPCPCGSGLKWKKCTCAKYHPEGTSTNEN